MWQACTSCVRAAWSRVGDLAALFILRVGRPPLGGKVKLIDQFRVAATPLVQAKGAVPDKLSHNEDGHLDIVGNRALLKRAGMAMFVQIDQELFILLHPFTGTFVGNSGGFDDTEVRS